MEILIALLPPLACAAALIVCFRMMAGTSRTLQLTRLSARSRSSDGA